MVTPTLDAEVIVVGGGAAGIAAAARLQSAGVDVLLVEAEEELGGKARSTTVDGTVIERGPNSFQGRHAALWSLLAMLGIEDSVVPLSAASRKRYLVRDGAIHAVEPHPLSLLTTEALTWRERLSVAREPFVARRQNDAEESVHAFFSRRFGSSLTEHVVAAALSGVFAGDIRNLSMPAALPALWEWEREHGSVLKGAMRQRGGRRGTYRLQGGFGRLGAAAAQRLRVRLGVAVAQVELDGANVALSVADGPILSARGVIIATEAHRAARLVADALPSIAATLDAVHYEPLTGVHWRTPASTPMPRGFGMLAAPCEKLFASGTIFTSDVRGDDARLYSSFVGGARGRDRAALDDRALAAGITADLESLGLVPNAVELVHVERWRHAVAQPTFGHAERTAALTRAGMPIAFAGSYLGAASVGDAVTSGFAAADRAAQRLRSARVEAPMEEANRGH